MPFSDPTPRLTLTRQLERSIDYVADLEDCLASTTLPTNFVSQCSYDDRFDSCRYRQNFSLRIFDNRYFPDQTFERCRANEVCSLFFDMECEFVPSPFTLSVLPDSSKNQDLTFYFSFSEGGDYKNQKAQYEHYINNNL